MKTLRWISVLPVAMVCGYLAYFVALPILAIQLDVLGAAIAQSVHNSVWLLVTSYLVLRTIHVRATATTSAIAGTREHAPKSSL